jgi:hypothetical protein
MTSSRMQGNPVPLCQGQLEAAFLEAL